MVEKKPEILPQEPQVFYNLTWQELKSHALSKNQAVQIRYEDKSGFHDGAFSIITRKNKRSPQDKYYVSKPENEGKYWERINSPMTEDGYELLLTDVQEYMKRGDVYIQDGALGVAAIDGIDSDMQM